MSVPLLKTPLTDEQRALAAEWVPYSQAEAMRLLKRHPFYAYLEPVVRADAQLALVRAAQTFDPAKGTFATHARWWVRAAVFRAFRAEVAKGYQVDLSEPCFLKSGQIKFIKSKTLQEWETMTVEECLPAECIETDSIAEANLVAKSLRRTLLKRVTPRLGKKRAKAAVDIFLRHLAHGELFAELGAERGVTRQAIEQQVRPVRKAFQEWASEVQQEVVRNSVPSV